MLNMKASALALCLLAVACGPPQTRGVTPAAGSPRAASVTPTAPVPSIPANAVVVEGGTTSMHLSRRRGTLEILVEVRRASDGTRTATVKYDRIGACTTEKVSGGNSVVNCPVLWSQRRKVTPDAFSVDPLLASATLTDTVRGLKVRATWTAFRDTERQINKNGNLLLETRDAVGDVWWGKDHYKEPKTADVPSGLFRRVTVPTAP